MVSSLSTARTRDTSARLVCERRVGWGGGVAALQSMGREAMGLEAVRRMAMELGGTLEHGYGVVVSWRPSGAYW